jgi:hypothetical protein
VTATHLVLLAFVNPARKPLPHRAPLAGRQANRKQSKDALTPPELYWHLSIGREKIPAAAHAIGMVESSARSGFLGTVGAIALMHMPIAKFKARSDSKRKLKAEPGVLASLGIVVATQTERSLDFTLTEQKTDPKKYLSTVLYKRFSSHFWFTGCRLANKHLKLGD